MLFHILYRAGHVFLSNFLTTQLLLQVLVFSRLQLNIQPQHFLHFQCCDVGAICGRGGPVSRAVSP